VETLGKGRWAKRLWCSGATGWGCALILVASVATSSVAKAESASDKRSYVVSFFAQQFTNRSGDCPKGINPEDERGQIAVILGTMGHSPAEVRRLMAGWDQGGEGERRVASILERRALIDGEPVNPMTHPEAVPDPNLGFVVARESIGFNLDNKISADDFVDAQTGEQGIDNALFRALGCNQNFRGTWSSPSAYGEWVWVQLRDSQPAWLVTLEGRDLDRDGPITVRIQRSLDHLRSNMDGSPRWHATYRVDPDPRSLNEYSGEIRNGEIRVFNQDRFSILWNGLSAPVLNLQRFNLRLKANERGELDGVIGGFQPWRELYFAFSHNGIVGDRPGLWHAMKKAADWNPDPATGQNLSISATYRLTAVPAFAVTVGERGTRTAGHRSR